jgi:hypothetical protein
VLMNGGDLRVYCSGRRVVNEYEHSYSSLRTLSLLGVLNTVANHREGRQKPNSARRLKGDGLNSRVA